MVYFETLLAFVEQFLHLQFSEVRYLHRLLLFPVFEVEIKQILLKITFILISTTNIPTPITLFLVVKTHITVQFP